jgi:hypothetical protein
MVIPGAGSIRSASPLRERLLLRRVRFHEAATATALGDSMRVSWDEVGQTEDEGTFIVRGQPVLVTRKEIEMWKEKPKALFETLDAPPGPDGALGPLLLGGWQLADDL